ncbi:uncharacterized protein J8A68_004736 [[Candida] subhashii]|uniref:Centrosomin N-terminal motif 1 domain-containing protein n=1 Tax=[Candida] subhashii TaxID=561895 RepID=A0A8J5UF72_9ASCO|nr:uncharacterized protein J8A68_004736 [[Candida] subhashii]KAG7661788.1 hypothetical protein J8A68_004736 [[Candida] subhashii]
MPVNSYLLGSPGQRPQQEFSPIGKSHAGQFHVLTSYPSSRDSTTNRSQQRSIFKLFKKPENFSYDNDESLFDDTLHSEQYDDDIDMRSPIKPLESQRQTSGQHHKLDDVGGISQGNEERIRQLHAENYSLKLKFMELREYVEGLPRSQQELMLENVDLKGEMTTIKEKLDQIMKENIILKERRGTSPARVSTPPPANNTAEIQGLRSEIDNLHHNLDIKSHELRGMNSKLEEYQQMINERDQQLAKLKSDRNQIKDLPAQYEHVIKELEEDIAHLKTQTNIDKQQVSELVGQLRNSEQMVDQLRSELDKNKSGQSHLVDERNHLLATEKEYNSKITDLQRQLRDKLDLEQILKSKNNELENKLSQRNQEIKQLDEKIISKTKTIADLEGEIEEVKFSTRMNSNQQTQELKLELERKNNEITSLKSKINELKDKNGDEIKLHKSKIRDLSHQLELKGEEIINLQRKLKSVENTYDSEVLDKFKFYEIEYEKIEQELHSKKEELIEYKNKLNQIKHERDQAIDKHEVLQREKNNNIHRLESLQGGTEKLEHTISNLKRSNAELERENHILEGQIYSLKSDVKDLKERHQREQESSNKILDSKIRSLQAENEDLQDEIVNLKSVQQQLDNEIRRVRRLSESGESKDEELNELHNDNIELAKQVETLKRLNQSANWDISDLMAEISVHKAEIDRLLSIKSRGEVHVGEYELKLEISKLREELGQSERYIEKLENDLQLKARQYKENKLYSDDLELELKKAKSLIGSYEDNITMLKNEIQDLETLNKSSSKESLGEAIKEIKAKHAEQKAEELSQKLDLSQKEIETLNETIKSIERDIRTLTEENSSLRTQNQSVQFEKNSLENNAKKLEQDLEVMTKSYKKMALKARDLRQVSGKRGKLYDDLKSEVLNNEMTYLKMTLTDVVQTKDDLETINAFMTDSINKSNNLSQNNNANLAKLGIYPEYVGSMKFHRSRGNQLTFKSLATFVLAAVRIKRRGERARKRINKLLDLRDDVNRGKSELGM